VLYVRRALQGRLQPAVFGWHNVACPNYVAQEQLKFRPDARRYEAGSQNLLGVVGLRAALSLLLEVGIDAIAAELARKRQLLVAGFTARGYQVLEAGAPAAQAASIVSAWRPDTDLAALWQRLEADRIITSLRADRSGRRYLRVAPHFYNTDAELERLLSRL
jgi:selenocysteine lyase/cysteine desulfurase